MSDNDSALSFPMDPSMRSILEQGALLPADIMSTLPKASNDAFDLETADNCIQEVLEECTDEDDDNWGSSKVEPQFVVPMAPGKAVTYATPQTQSISSPLSQKEKLACITHLRKFGLPAPHLNSLIASVQGSRHSVIYWEGFLQGMTEMANVNLINNAQKSSATLTSIQDLITSQASATKSADHTLSHVIKSMEKSFSTYNSLNDKLDKLTGELTSLLKSPPLHTQTYENKEPVHRPKPTVEYTRSSVPTFVAPSRYTFVTECCELCSTTESIEPLLSVLQELEWPEYDLDMLRSFQWETVVHQFNSKCGSSASDIDLAAKAEKWRVSLHEGDEKEY